MPTLTQTHQGSTGGDQGFDRGEGCPDCGERHRSPGARYSDPAEGPLLSHREALRAKYGRQVPHQSLAHRVRP
ncbi:hypothetical protein KI387_043977 [Taxus chinensis]|uniref:Uncharacterized protein n=1 Tax=Taxus chinensis TaxID=29808 RepID=A0AA38GCD0_TAXCH|nr:hypothetical protein KI387_043977 [Taxus chinensis]